MTDTEIQGKLAEYEGIIRMLTGKVEELAAANERLTSELTGRGDWQQRQIKRTSSKREERRFHSRTWISG